jgi:hypothetical protein
MLELAARATDRARVGHACVILTKGRDPGFVAPYDPPVKAARESLQAAALFCDADLISAAGVARVARRLRGEWAWTDSRLKASLEDLEARRMLDPERLRAIRQALERS